MAAIKSATDFLLAFGEKKKGFSPEKKSFSVEKRGFSLEKKGFAPEKKPVSVNSLGCTAWTRAAAGKERGVVAESLGDRAQKSAFEPQNQASTLSLRCFRSPLLAPDVSPCRPQL